MLVTEKIMIKNNLFLFVHFLHYANDQYYVLLLIKRIHKDYGISWRKKNLIIENYKIIIINKIIKFNPFYPWKKETKRNKTKQTAVFTQNKHFSTHSPMKIDILKKMELKYKICDFDFQCPIPLYSQHHYSLRLTLPEFTTPFQILSTFDCF